MDIVMENCNCSINCTDYSQLLPIAIPAFVGDLHRTHMFRSGIRGIIFTGYILRKTIICIGVLKTWKKNAIIEKKL